MPLAWRVEYAPRGVGPIVAIEGRHGWAWRELATEGVVRVHVLFGHLSHVLQGFDNYWIDGLLFGVFNDRANAGWYPGEQALAWAWPSPTTCVRIANADPPRGAHVLRGVMLDDAFARELGLLGPGEHSPPRPR